MSTPVPPPNPFSLREQQSILFTIVDAVLDPIFIKDLDGRYLLTNLAHAHLHGADRDALYGKSLTDLPNVRPFASQYIADDQYVLTTGKAIVNREEPYISASGRKGWFLTSKHPLYGDSGKVVGLVGIARDITAIKESAEELAATRELLEDHVANSPLAVIEWDAAMRIRRWAGQAERIFGWCTPMAVGKTSEALDMVYVEDMHRIKTVRERFQAGEQHVVAQIRNVTRTGRIIHCIWHNSALRNEQGEVFSVFSLIEDVTERVEAEQQLAEERSLLQRILDAIPDPIILKGPTGTTTYQNRAGWRTPSISRMEQVANVAREAEDDRCVLEMGVEVVNREERFVRVDGGKGWMLTSKHPVRDAEGTVTGLVAISRDITELRRAREELESTRQRLVDHVENSPLAVVEWNADFRVCRWSPQAEQLFGWPAQEVLGLHSSDWNFVHPTDEPIVYGAAERLADGTEMRNICATRNFRKDGSVAHCVWHNSVLRDSSGQVLSMLSLIQDVTERVQAEEAVRAAESERLSMERRLLETQKLESLGVLAGGIAHDFNNLLTTILGNASLAAAELGTHAQISPLLEQIETAGTRAADLCRQMLAYAGKGKVDVRLININKLIVETADLLKVSISKRVSLSFDLDPTLPPVLGDATQMRQILMNLIINASEAVGDRDGIVSLKTSVTTETSQSLWGMFSSPQLPDGQYVSIEVVDDGCGMSAEILNRVFDPFFTTKFAGRGLGLAAVLGIVRAHSGALSVQSRPGLGTWFRVVLPKASGTSDPGLGVADAASRHWRGKGTILFVDDEPTVRGTGRRMLEAMGFHVREAEHGRAAMDVYMEAPDSFVAAFIDLTMPHMDGVQTLEAIRTHRPDAIVILMSGYSESDVLERAQGKCPSGFVQKPFRLPVLRDLLRSLMPG